MLIKKNLLEKIINVIIKELIKETTSIYYKLLCLELINVLNNILI